MNLYRKYIAFLLSLVFVVACSGCGNAVSLHNRQLDNTTFLNYNGSGVPVSTDNPAESYTGTVNTGTISETTTATVTEITAGSHTSVTPPASSVYSQQEISTVVDTTYTEATTAKPVTDTTTLTSQSTPAQVIEPPADDMPVNNYTALNHSEVKGVWISYFELYPILTGKNSYEFRTGIGEYYDNALSLGINTVYVHVRPYGDSMYKSDYYPWSKYCTGYIDQDPGFDPLEIMIDEAHKRNISFHAWINPMRCSQQDDMPKVSDVFPTKDWYNNKYGEYIVKINGYWYLNPAYDEVTDLIADGTAEIVSRYDVDGVHIDDYFYPTTDASFDYTAFAASGYSSLEQFRLDNCTKMVDKMYKAVKSHNSTALFGVSAQGNVTNNREVLYADVEKWCTEKGYVDYMAPQIYYGFENSGQPFMEVVDQWDEMLRGTGKRLIPGLAVYKIGTEDTWAGSGKYEWINDTEIIRRQIEYSRTADTYSGIILYSYQFIFSPDSNVSVAVNAEIDAFAPLLR